MARQMNRVRRLATRYCASLSFQSSTLSFSSVLSVLYSLAHSCTFPSFLILLVDLSQNNTEECVCGGGECVYSVKLSLLGTQVQFVFFLSSRLLDRDAFEQHRTSTRAKSQTCRMPSVGFTTVHVYCIHPQPHDAPRVFLA